MDKTYYSTDSESFEHETLDEALAALLAESKDIVNGDIISIECGESNPVHVRGYIPDVLEGMRDRAAEDMGEFSDGFLSLSKSEEERLQFEIGTAIIHLLRKKELMPTFYKIINIRAIVVKVLNTNDATSYEIVDDEPQQPIERATNEH